MDLKISIVSCCYNPDLAIFEKMLSAIKRQTYPKKLIEHLVMDGGSTNGAGKLAKKYGCRVYEYPKLLNKALVRMSLGIKKAKGDLVLLLEPDNIMVGKNWLDEMIEPFTNNEQIVGAFSLYNSYTKDMPLLTKYCALFGVNDPVIHYLNKSEKLVQYKKNYDKGELILRTKKYSIVKFNKDNFPTLGDNGHMVRRSAIMKVNKDSEKFLHTDAFFDMLELGFDEYAVVNNSIIHYMGSSIINFFNKRVRYKGQFYDNNKYKRSYFVYNPKVMHDRIRLIMLVIFGLTFIEPLIESLRGYMVKREIAWFLHPVVTFAAVIAYSGSELKLLMNKK